MSHKTLLINMAFEQTNKNDEDIDCINDKTRNADALKADEGETTLLIHNLYLLFLSSIAFCVIDIKVMQ